MPSSNSRATPELQYPPAQADRSLTSLDLSTLMMKSTTRRLSEEPGSSLDDSTYEVLTDSLIETSDDEAHTESIASTSDAPTPDDVSAFSDDDDFENDDRALDQSIQSMHAAAANDDLETPLVTDGEDSMLTMVPDHMGGSGGPSMLQFDEEHTEDAEASLGTLVVKTFSTHTEELPPVLESYGKSQIRVVVKAALSPQYIPPPESYKILYVGMPEKWVQDSITVHVHAALTASPNNTRSVMVRGQMEPLGPVIHAHRCAQFEVYNADATHPDILVRMDDGIRLRIDRQKAPQFDLVILCHTQKRESTADSQTYNSLRTALRQHQIPMIELSEIKPYGAGTHTYDMQSLVACLEGRNDEKAEFELLEVLPLDAFTFCELEPFQINRHLALISPHLVPSAVEVAPKPRFSAIGDTLRGVGKQLRTGAPATTKVLFCSIALTAMLSAFVLSPLYMPLVLQKPAQSLAEPSTLSMTSTSCPLITPPATSSSSVAVVTSPAASSSILNVPKGLTIVASQAGKLRPKQDKKKKDNKLSGFDIQTAGERHFILTPSRELASSRKKPQLQIQVFRNTTLIPIRYVRTITGEYFVDLEDEYPFSTFNVSIVSYSKPLIQQSFEVQLGHNKTWVDQILGEATSMIHDAQVAFTDISSAAMRQAQARARDVVNSRIGEWMDGRRLEEAAYRSAEGGLKSGAKFMEHVPEATWVGLRKITAPIRLSNTMWMARMNALRVRCNAESTVGRLLNLSNKQPSRTCAKLQEQAQERKEV